VPTGEALVPLFDYSRVSVAYDISGDVVVIRHSVRKAEPKEVRARPTYSILDNDCQDGCYKNREQKAKNGVMQISDQIVDVPPLHVYSDAGAKLHGSAGIRGPRRFFAKSMLNHCFVLFYNEANPGVQ